MISILVLSSDGYSDCWDPFFTLFKRNFPGVENHELILSTNEKEYEYPGLNIKTLKNGNEPWSKRLRLSLQEAQNETVLILVEDFFLLSELKQKVFTKLCELINNEEGIDHIRLLYKIDKVKTRKSKFELIDEIMPRSNYRFLYLPGLWKKAVLSKYVVDFESPYMAEKMGSWRSWILNDGFYAISKDYVMRNGRLYDCSTSGAIIKGKWGEWLPKRMRQNDLEIEYNYRGFKTKETNKKARLNAQLELVKQPFSTVKSIMATMSLLFKT